MENIKVVNCTVRYVHPSEFHIAPTLQPPRRPHRGHSPPCCHPGTLGTHPKTVRPNPRRFLHPCPHPLFSSLSDGKGQRPSPTLQPTESRECHPLLKEPLTMVSNPDIMDTLKSPEDRAQQPGTNILGDISGNVGLVSAGRINKDTPPLTTPSYTSKSSAMDTSSHIF